MKNLKWLGFVLLSLLIISTRANAIEEIVIAKNAISPDDIAKTYIYDSMFTVNNLWVLIATFMVFIMHLGFATLECGLTRAKNTVNILFKNSSIIAIGIITYAILGFNLMYPGDNWLTNGIIGQFVFGINPGETGQTMAYGGYTYYTDFIFQSMFAATAVTIVAGAVAERVKLLPFLIFSVIYAILVYPIVGSWGWGGGWLDQLAVPFHDFAGSTFVHSVGGWGALAAIMLLGARTGKFGPDGKARGIPGHSMPLASIGAFLLWFGWFGFNGGSVLSANPNAVSHVFVTTSIGSATGTFGAMILSWVIQKKPDLSMVLNGSLAGLVAITAGADCITPGESALIGFVGGCFVVLAVFFFDNVLKLDDPVGATSVHLINGVWGTLAVGIWGKYKINELGDIVSFTSMGGKVFHYSIVSQLYGALACAIFSFITAYIIIYIIKKTLGFRVTQEEEIAGLDIGEHGMESYAGFQIFLNQ